MIPIRRVWPICVLLSGILSGPAHAALISASDPHFGAGSITRDTNTGLEWLDVTVSFNLSYNAVSAQFGPGGQFEGFRYGTRAEVDQLFRHAGFAQTDDVPRAADFAVAQNFMSLVAVAPPGGASSAIVGRTGDFAFTISGVGFRQVFYVRNQIGAVLDSSTGAANGLDANGGPFYGDSFANGGTGSWLVRPTVATVPEPTSVLVFSAALIFSATFLRRRQ